ncbi:MAG: hypothetical protein GX247_04250 [Mollicutes bacterium]|nr:hypothetical protein [Mollicutes bacterium]
MTGETYLKKLIQSELQQVKLLREEPDVDVRLVNDILWDILGLALQFDAWYDKKLQEIDQTEVVTIDEELKKRQKMVEWAKRREKALEEMFDRNDPDQKDLADLFDDIRKQALYTRVFYQSDTKFVKKQIVEREHAHKRVDELKAERGTIEREIEELKKATEDFEGFNAKLNSEFEKLITEHQIDSITDIDIESYFIAKQYLVEKISVAEKYANGITNSKLKEVFENDIKKDKEELENAERAMFLYGMGELLRENVNSFEKLLRKMNKINEYATIFERGNSERSSLTKSFIFDTIEIEKILNTPRRIAELEERINDIDVAIENAYDNVKGLREINNVINNIEPEYPIKEEIKGEVKEIEPTVITSNVEANKLNDGEYKVTKKEKAKSSLLEKIREYKKEIIAAVAMAPIIAITMGVVSALFPNNIKIGNSSQLATYIEQKVDLEPHTQVDQIDIESSTSDIVIADTIDKAINETIEDIEKQYSVTIGDQVFVSNGVKYYRNSPAAQFGQNVFETGRSGLKEGNYYVNKIALLQKDAIGQPTGHIIAVNDEPGVSAEELATSLGLAKGTYDVIMHISLGNTEGEFVEYVEGIPNNLCWIKTIDGKYLDGLSLTKSANEVLSKGRGMAR